MVQASFICLPTFWRSDSEVEKEGVRSMIGMLSKDVGPDVSA